MTTAIDVTVLILAKHEAENLRELIPATRAILQRAAIVHEFIVVAATQADAEAVPVGDEVNVIRQSEPGYGRAFREGIAAARGGHVLTLDADFSHDPAVILHLWEARNGRGLVIASRYVPGGSADTPWYRRYASRLLNAFYRRGLSLAVRDMSSAYRLYRCDAIAGINLAARHFDVLEEVLVGINADGWEISEVPFHYAPRRHGASNVRLLSFGWAFARTFLRMWVLRNSPFSADYDERAFNSLIPLQRYWQRTRHLIITEMVAGGGRVLDVGCGSSRIIQDLPRTVGLDIQLKKLRRIQRGRVRVVQGTLTMLPFPDATFDQLICSQVIEHVSADLVNWSEFSRVLRPGGRLIVGTPDYGTFTWPVLERLYDLVHPRGYVKEHINHYTAASLRHDLERNGFRIDALRYVGGGEMIYKTTKIASAGALETDSG